MSCQLFRKAAVLFGKLIGESCYTPYEPVTGSRKRGIFGEAKVRTAKVAAIRHKTANATGGDLQKELFPFRSLISEKYAAPAAKRKITILNQSGEVPNIPVTV